MKESRFTEEQIIGLNKQAKVRRATVGSESGISGSCAVPRPSNAIHSTLKGLLCNFMAMGCSGSRAPAQVMRKRSVALRLPGHRSTTTAIPRSVVIPTSADLRA